MRHWVCQRKKCNSSTKDSTNYCGKSGVADVVDPLGGSWLVEKLTSQIMKEAMEQITEIEKLGGA